MKKVAVVGAGLVGSLEAIFLAKRGYEVEVLERRPDMRKADTEGGRSINLALSDRGWKALAQAGIEEDIRKVAIPMEGRMMHYQDTEQTFQPYGKEGQAIYSVSRGGLNLRMIEKADEYENVTFYFNRKCKDIDLHKPGVILENPDGKEERKEYDFIIGSDGAFSAVRTRMQKTDRFDYSQSYLAHGYKELSIPPGENGTHLLEKNALHIWPRGEFMMIALPNLDGSFTCTLFLPFEGNPSFDTLDSPEHIKDFFEKTFPDAVPLMPTLLEDFQNNPTSSLATIHCEPWNYQDKVLLIGDASHAIVPFYGQGMNAGFEDTTVLEEFMDRHDDRNTLFQTFSKHRKPDSDAIAELAVRNFIEMRDKTADPEFLLQKKIEKRLSEKYPDQWMPLYSQVTFSHIPYSEALKQGNKQEAIMQKVMKRSDIEEKWDSEEIEKEILEELDQ